MSRVAKIPVLIPKGVEVDLKDQICLVKGPKGSLELDIHPFVQVVKQDDSLQVSVKTENRKAVALSGTMRALIANMVYGVSEGFEQCLELHGVGYRVRKKGSQELDLSLGFSHPVYYQIPDGLEITIPNQTTLVIKGIDKQLVGQAAAKIRAYRPPECYKGKGVRYKGEEIVLKEVKKK